MNRWAVVALVAGILPLFPLAIGAGITALVQISRRAQRGTALAVVGLVLAGLWVVGGGVAVLGSVVNSGGSSQGNLGRVADAGSTTVGACLLAPGDQDSIGSVVDCASSHDAEVFAVVSLGEDRSWPGYDPVDQLADSACSAAFPGYVGAGPDKTGYDYGFFDPDQGEWRAGEHRVVCVVLPGSDGDTMEGSARNAG